MLRAVLARLRMWLDLLIGVVGPRIRRTRPCPACRRQIPKGALKCRFCGTWRALGRPLVGLGAMAPSSLPTVYLMHATQIVLLAALIAFVAEHRR